MAAKGPYGNQNPRKLPKWNLQTESAPKQVSRGTLSRPVPLPKWNPTNSRPQDRAPHVVQR